MSIQIVNTGTETEDSQTPQRDLSYVFVDGRQLIRREYDDRTEYVVSGRPVGAGLNHPTASPSGGRNYGPDEAPLGGPYSSSTDVLGSVTMVKSDRKRLREYFNALDD